MPKKQEAQPPTLRLVGPSGIVIYPKLIKDLNGEWQVKDPEAIDRLLGRKKQPSPTD